MTGLTRWQHPVTGVPITFQDCRPQPEPDPPVVFPFTVEDVAGHEARHAAAGLLMGMRVIEARADWPEMKTLGYVQFAGAEADVRDVMVLALVGAMGDDAMNGPWPPAWPLDPDSKIADERSLAKHASQIALTNTATASCATTPDASPPTPHSASSRNT
jgi:hypothetical protein